MRGYLAIFIGIVLFGCLGSGCPDTVEPVCGSDGNTYDNSCLAEKAGVEVESQGSCEPPPLECLDSDQGKDIFTQGQVLGGGNTYTDGCLNNVTVEEFFCDARGPNSEDITCPDGYLCDGGKCIAKPCEDSDNGINPGEKGLIVVGPEGEADSCEENGSLKEFYCDEGKIAFEYIECAENEHCLLGACVEKQCEDSDGGSDKFKFGTTSYLNESYNDSCVTMTAVKEYFCSVKEISSVNLACGEGYMCQDGKCIEVTECTDPDNGKDKYEKTIVTSPDGVFEDSCENSGNVREYFCLNGEVKSDVMECPEDHNCIDGECRPVECKEYDSDFEEENVRYKITNFNSNDKLRLYDGEIVEINNMILELDDTDGNEAFFNLYLDYGDYLDNDEECSDSATKGNSINDMCDESTGEIEIDSVNESRKFADIYLEEFPLIEYYSGKGENMHYAGYGCIEEDKKIYYQFDAVFFPYLDTANSELDMEDMNFNFLGETAKIKDTDPETETFTFEIGSKRYKLIDGEDFEFGEQAYDVDVVFDRGGLIEIRLAPA